ncbi:MAG: HAMP domain-containing protein [Thermodesulfovibrionales bacterium]|nr:HAMP domain-containing protein [Thermodesulfovibrionales bacterium]
MGSDHAKLHLLKRVSGSLTGKLVLVLGALILAGSVIFLYTAIRTDQRNLMNSTLDFVSSLSEVMKKSVRHDMLTFQRAEIQKTLESIGETGPIEKVRIFNSKGIIYYSSDRAEIQRRVDSSSPACIGCHTDPSRPLDTLVSRNQWTIFKAPDGQRILSFVEPIYNEPDCYSSMCHVHSGQQKVLGVLETDFSLYPMDMALRKQALETSLYILSFLAVSVALLCVVLWRLVLKPVGGLSMGMKRVSSGDLLQKVPVLSDDEIGRLARTFNDMTDELNLSRIKLESWTQSLEHEVVKKTNDIKRTQDKLIQAEKLAALGRLTADIAHEIRNPLTALGGFGRRLQKYATDEKEREYADIVVSEVERLEHILRDVMTFSRDPRLHFKRQPLTETISVSLLMFDEMCKENSIRIEKDLGTDLPVIMDAEQVRQAVNNLISNALDAMPEGGTLSVSTSAEEINDVTFVAVHVSDTGPGIPEAELPIIFEPFHTTKMIGHGTGLGLSISRKIMEEHGGFINAANRVEGGLTVSLYFPYQSDEDMAGTKCWEFMGCGRDTGKEAKCPAYPNFGRVCWVVAGTFCEGRVQGTFAQKYEDCRKCAFYNKKVNKEI